jgi:hypothetical protein
MASPQLQTVIQGFKVMGEKMAQAGGDLKAMRALWRKCQRFRPQTKPNVRR